MSKQETIRASARTMVQVTDAGVTHARVQNIGFRSLLLVPGADGTAPTSPAGGFMLEPGDYLSADINWVGLFPGAPVTAALWAYSDDAVHLSVSHGDA